MGLFDFMHTYMRTVNGKCLQIVQSNKNIRKHNKG